MNKDLIGKTILIVDDSATVRQLFSFHLMGRGFRLLEAENGAEALKLAIKNKPDLILLDIQMPVMDGVEVFSHLRQREETKDIPVLVITTIGRKKDEAMFRRAGVDEFLSKPIHEKDLIQKVTKLLQA